MQNFNNLTLTQKAMVMAYKHGHRIPFLEEIVQERAKNDQKMAIQKAYAQAHESLIGDEEQRRKYWIAKMKE